MILRRHLVDISKDTNDVVLFFSRTSVQVRKLHHLNGPLDAEKFICRKVLREKRLLDTLSFHFIPRTMIESRIAISFIILRCVELYKLLMKIIIYHF